MVKPERMPKHNGVLVVATHLTADPRLPPRRLVVTPLGMFTTLQAAANVHKCSRQNVHQAVKRGRPGWTYLNLQAGE
jgi:hypothetical protein